MQGYINYICLITAENNVGQVYKNPDTVDTVFINTSSLQSELCCTIYMKSTLQMHKIKISVTVGGYRKRACMYI